MINNTIELIKGIDELEEAHQEFQKNIFEIALKELEFLAEELFKENLFKEIKCQGGEYYEPLQKSEAFWILKDAIEKFKKQNGKFN